MTMAKQYNYCLDWIKGIACICVVFMHCEFPGLLGTAVQAISRFCVPFFFMVSGYFCFKSDIVSGKGRRINDKVVHVLKIIINACIFYTLFMVLLCLLGKEIVWSISKYGVLSWIIFNTPSWAGVAGQYWFLFALLYTYAFYAILMRHGWLKQAYWVAAVMFVVYVIMAQGMHLIGIRVPNMIYRNWLVEGFAYFMLGHWIHHHQERLNFDNKILMAIIITTTLLCWVERYIMGRDFGVNIVTIPQVFCLFLYAVNNPEKHKGVVQEIGKRYSMFVYILHPAIWHSLELVYEKIGISDNMVALYLLPIIVVVLTLFASHIVYVCNNRMKLSKV